MNRKEMLIIESWNTCPFCGEVFESKHGVSSHKGHKHHNSSIINFFTEKEKKELKRRKDRGENISDIAKDFFVSADDIRRVIRDFEKGGGETAVRECAYCGEKFKPLGGAKYCSKKCSTMANINPDYFSVFYRDRFRCRYCGKTPLDGVKLTVDHVYPQSKGGSNEKVNLVTACQNCNSHKSDRVWPKKRVKEIWWKNKKLQEKEELSFEEMFDEFKEEYPEEKPPALRGGA